MPTTISGSSGVTYPSGGVDNVAGAGVGTTDTQTLTNKTLGSGLVAGASLITSGTVNGGGTAPFPASAGPTSVNFTGIPSWVKRITVMFSGVSLNSTSDILVQIGSGSVTTTGYISTGNNYNGSNATGSSNSTAGFVIKEATAANAFSGHMIITAISGNTWISSHTGSSTTVLANNGGGNVTLSGALDRLRITTVNSTDVFDAGLVNILYE